MKKDELTGCQEAWISSSFPQLAIQSKSEKQMKAREHGHLNEVSGNDDDEEEDDSDAGGNGNKHLHSLHQFSGSLGKSYT